MDAHANAPGHAGGVRLRLPFLLGAAVLCGIAVFCMPSFLITMNWDFFAVGVTTGTFGGLLLFSRGTGPDRS
jgi:hypothetical protein